MRGILGELQIIDVRTYATLSLFTGFKDYSTFKPTDLHLNNVNRMLDQVIIWNKVLKPLHNA
ncbi:hypothetical protein NCCP28_42570 [Niallia sp. NCCP-28]|nr:hypothetical protein NCCP28_42570 [Niallia sp. NCCP-28]